MTPEEQAQQALAQQQSAAPPSPPGSPEATPTVPDTGGVPAGTDEFEKMYGKGQDAVPSTLQPTPIPKPAEEASPTAPAAKNDDATRRVSDATYKSKVDAESQEFDEMFGTKGGPKPASADGATPGAPPAAPAKPAEEPSKTKGVVLDILHGFADSPSAVVGGMLDYVDNIQKLGEALVDDVLKLPRSKPDEPVRAGEWVAPPGSVTGKMMRGISTFLTSFATVGAAGEAAGIPIATGTLARASTAVAKGALAEFVGVDGHSGNLANLVAEHSDLLKPVADIFATHSGDTELQGRFKNAITNAMVGAPAEAIVPVTKALFGAVQYLKNAQGVYDFARFISKFTQEEPLPALKVQPFQTLVLGDPNASMLRTAKEINGEIGHDINFAAIHTDDDIKTVLGQMTKAEESIAGRSDRTVSWVEAEKEATGINAFKDMLGRRGGDGVSQGQIVAFRKFRAAAAEKAYDMQRLATEVPTEVNQANALKMNRLFAFAHSATEDIRAESGRILNANKIKVGGEDLADTYAKFLEDNGGYGPVLDGHNKLAKLERPAWSYMTEQLGKLNKITSDAVAQTFVNGLFSLPVIGVKLSSDFYNIAKVTADTTVAAHLSEALGTDGGVQFGEAAARIHGLVSAQKEAMYALAQNLRNAKSFSDLTSAPGRSLEDVKGALPFEVPQPGKLRAENFHISSDTMFGKGLDLADKVTTTMGRLITLQDRYAKMLAYRAEVHAQVYRQAFQDMAAGKVTAAPPSPKSLLQRFEQPGVAPGTVSKPQGLYLSPGDVESPHADLGGAKSVYQKNPNAKILDLDTTDPIIAPRDVRGGGMMGQSTGIAAARKFLGENEFQRLLNLPNEELRSTLASKYPDVDWSKYADKLEMIEAQAGLEGRKAGYDVFSGTDRLHPEFSEYVGLTDESIKPVLPTFDEHVANLLKSVPEDIHMEGVTAANVATFTQEPGETLSRLGNAIQSIPVLGRVLLPFKTVPSNIFTETFQNTALAPLVQSWRADIAAGGARADMAMARMATGQMQFNVMMDLAMKGTITGKGPERPGERQNWERLGNKPYSVMIGNTAVSLHRLGIFGVQLGIAADIGEAIVNAESHVEDRDFTKLMTAAVFSISNSVMSETYMKGSADFINAVTNPEQKGPNYLKHLAGELTPMSGLSGTVARSMDPYARTADGFIQAMRRKIPALSSDLPMDRDLWGQPKSYRSPVGWFYDAVSPFWVSRGEPQAIDQEMKKIGYFPTDVPKSIHDGRGTSVELTGAQISRYKELAGNEWKDPTRGGMGARDYLNAVVTGDNPRSATYQSYKDLDAKDGGDRAKTFIEHTIKDYRDKARISMIHEDGHLATDIDLKHDKNPNYVPVRNRTFDLKQN